MWLATCFPAKWSLRHPSPVRSQAGARFMGLSSLSLSFGDLGSETFVEACGRLCIQSSLAFLRTHLDIERFAAQGAS